MVAVEYLLTLNPIGIDRATAVSRATKYLSRGLCRQLGQSRGGQRW